MLCSGTSSLAAQTSLCRPSSDAPGFFQGSVSRSGACGAAGTSLSSGTPSADLSGSHSSPADGVLDRGSASRQSLPAEQHPVAIAVDVPQRGQLAMARSKRLDLSTPQHPVLAHRTHSAAPCRQGPRETSRAIPRRRPTMRPASRSTFGKSFSPQTMRAISATIKISPPRPPGNIAISSEAMSCADRDAN